MEKYEYVPRGVYMEDGPMDKARGFVTSEDIYPGPLTDNQFDWWINTDKPVDGELVPDWIRDLLQKNSVVVTRAETI